MKGSRQLLLWSACSDGFAGVLGGGGAAGAATDSCHPCLCTPEPLVTDTDVQTEAVPHRRLEGQSGNQTAPSRGPAMTVRGYPAPQHPNPASSGSEL